MIVPSADEVRRLFLEKVPYTVWSDSVQEVFAILIEENPEHVHDELYEYAVDLVHDLLPNPA